VPQLAVDRLPGKVITIRYFYSNNEDVAESIKKLLIGYGYDGSSVTVENMIPFVNKLYPGYIEIWSK
jgi:hypothetical protein